jgi:spore germination cell wall hydrolase CwlJ-like protein
LNLLFRTRVSARALLFSFCALLGVAFGATCLADGSDPHPAHAYARALKSGYAAHIDRPRPPVGGPRALDCLAAAVYYEARGENAAGRAAVAQVVLNRTRRSGYPKSICAVVHQGEGQGECQFSFVCNGAMKGRRERLAWADARRIAARALDGYVMAAVGKANCFHALAARQAAVGGVRVGRQVFYVRS